MATFTIRLHKILGVDQPEAADHSLIGLDQYPIWDPGYRWELNHKIVMRYWNREIGFQTVEEFIHHMRRTMGEIMPYYNQLARTTLWEFDPFETYLMTSESESEHESDSQGATTGQSASDVKGKTSEESESSNTQKSDNESRTVHAEHPQTRLSGDEHYATASTEVASASDSTSGAETTGSQETDQHSDTTSKGTTTGKQAGKQRDQSTQRGTQGNKSVMLQQYRETITDVDMQILLDLEDLFMGVWDTDASYTGHHYYTPFFTY